MINMEANVPLTLISNDLTRKNKVELYLLREDLIHPEISGNKWRKLKYNLQKFKEGGYDQILTFGGAFSNHIAATAAAGKIFNIPTIGIIRGEATYALNSTLDLAQKNGMHLEFIGRTNYRQKNDLSFQNEIQKSFPKALIIPEGGSNFLGFKGCTEIIHPNHDFDLVCSAVGTGCTFSGLVASLQNKQKALGFPVLKGANYLEEDIFSFLNEKSPKENKNWELDYKAHYGGYGKYSSEICDFINNFQQEFQVKLDPVYTGKMLCRIFEMLKNRDLQNKKIIAIHTGGLQGINGYQQRYKVNIFDE